MENELKDIDGAVHMMHDHGERFLGWYLFKTFVRKESYPLNYKDKDLRYLFTVLDYNIRFIMPSKLEYNNGMISYTTGERELGIFRFPRDEKGNFVAPYPLLKPAENLRNLSSGDVEEILKRKSPLIFEAYKIPQYGFEIIDVNKLNMEEITKLTDLDFVMSMKEEHDRLIRAGMEEIKQKINSSVNYLLIMINVLDCRWKNLDEVAYATNGIIHI